MLHRLLRALHRVATRLGDRSPPPWVLRSNSSPHEVPGAVYWLMSADEEDREPIAEALAALMRKVQSVEWTGLYSGFRYAPIRPSDVPSLARLNPDDAVELLGVATLNASGYTREAALHALAGLGHPRAVPYVLLRQGDWVEAVRLAAADSLRSLLTRDVAGQLIQNHGLVTRLGLVDRPGVSRLQLEIFASLRAPRGRPTLESAIASGDGGTRLFCLKVLTDELPERPDLVERAVRDSHPPVRMLIARLAGREALTLPAAAMQALLQDRMRVVSTTLIRAMTPQMVEDHAELLTRLALSDARSVREAARWSLRTLGHVDLAAICRKRLAASSEDLITPGLVSCLGETGEAKDIALVLPLLSHPRSRVRAAAVAAMGRLAPVDAAPVVMSHLEDPGSRVRRSTVALLLSVSPELWLRDAQRVFNEGSPEAQVAALRLLASRSGWDPLPSLLQGLMSASTAVVETAWHGIDVWLYHYGPRGWIRPSTDCETALRGLWPEVLHHVEPPPGRAELWSQLGRSISDALARP